MASNTLATTAANNDTAHFSDRIVAP